MTTSPGLATANLADIAPGTHLCAFYDSDEQLARIASTFVARGLAAGDRLLYIAEDDDAATSMLGSLLGDVPGRHALASGQLEIQSFGDTYGDVHAGDLALIEAGFRAAAEQARTRGFPGLRVAAEMGDFARFLGSSDEVIRWERRSTAMQRELGVTSVCQYDLRHLDGRRGRPPRRRARGARPGPRRPPDGQRSSPSASRGDSRSRARWTSPTGRP